VSANSVFGSQRTLDIALKKKQLDVVRDFTGLYIDTQGGHKAEYNSFMKQSIASSHPELEFQPGCAAKFRRYPGFMTSLHRSEPAIQDPSHAQCIGDFTFRSKEAGFRYVSVA
jgi:hypothetical protein